MKVAAFLAACLALTDAQTTQDCLTQSQINNLSSAQLANLATPIGPQQAALAELLQLYGIYGSQQFNLNTATGSCASRCVTGGVVGRTSNLGVTTGCVPSFTSGGITYTYVDGQYIATNSQSSTFTPNTFGPGCQCDQGCAARADCCVDYRTACGLANGNRYAYQIIETVEVPVAVPVPYIVEVPQPYAVPVAVGIAVPVARQVPVPVAVDVNVPVPVNVPVNVPVPVNSPISVAVPVARVVNNPVAVTVPVGVSVPVSVNVPVNAPVDVNVPVNVPVPYAVGVAVPYGVSVPYNVPVPVAVNQPVAVNTPVAVNVPVSVPVPVNVPRTVQVPYGVNVEVVQYRDVPVPVPVPVYVNNPVPVDYVVNVVQDVPVDVEVPVLVDVNVPVAVNQPVPFNVNRPVNAPVLVNVPYSVREEVQVPVNMPVGYAVEVPRTVDIEYTVNNPVTVQVNRPVEIIEYVNIPVPVEVQRAVAQISVPVYLGYQETGTVLTGIEGVPTAWVTGTERVEGEADVSGITSVVREPVVVEQPRGVISRPSIVNSACTLGQVYPDFTCQAVPGSSGNTGVWVYTGTTNTVSRDTFVAGGQCLTTQVFSGFSCVNGVWVANTINRSRVACTDGTISGQFVCNNGAWVLNTASTISSILPPAVNVPTNNNLLLIPSP